VLAKGFEELGVQVWAHDPYVKVWSEAPEVPLSTTPDIYSSMKGADVIMLVMNHQQYGGINPQDVLRATGRLWLL